MPVRCPASTGCFQVTLIAKSSLGPNVFGISPEVPEDCHVDRAAYVSRHGSRYPDQGAYDGWVSMYERVSFNVSGILGIG